MTEETVIEAGGGGAALPEISVRSRDAQILDDQRLSTIICHMLQIRKKKSSATTASLCLKSVTMHWTSHGLLVTEDPFMLNFMDQRTENRMMNRIVHFLSIVVNTPHLPSNQS